MNSMLSFKKLANIAGLVVLAITFSVFYSTAERTGSLWDCGEFILGAYKLQVVHPPGAGLFLIIGRIFAWIATIFSSDKSDIAFAVNLLSGLGTAISAMAITWCTMIIGKLAIIGRDEEPTPGQNIVLALSGIASGLSSAWITSVWFSAVEGEVYALSLMFSSLTIWAAIKWYHLPNNSDNDRWLILAMFLAGLSVGVHLLSILSMPAIAILYYFKKYEQKSTKGFLLCLAAGLFMIYFIMKIVIVGIPKLWSWFELMFVNGFGLPFNSGILPTLLVVAAAFYFMMKYAHKKGNQLLQNFIIAAAMIVVAYSTVGVVVIRANADTPINMNTPNDAFRLIPYLNREQYGERPLLKGPHYLAKPTGVKTEPRYGKLGNKYAEIDEKFDYTWKESDKILFPRIGHQDKADLHMRYKERLTGSASGKPSFAYNIAYLFKYQLSHMYFRYFFWNFIGRQNFDQATDIWEVKDGNWTSGIKAYDDNRLYNTDLEPDEMRNAPTRNKYYFIPFLLGLLGMVFHFNKSRKDFLALFAYFIISGVGLVIYANSPPIEPRERDYTLVSSFIIYCMWIGIAGLAIFEILSKSVKLPAMPSGFIGGAVTLIVPFLLISQNYDDNDRSQHAGSRDYAANFLNSVEKNAIIFTYGDNDTYPLWYAQEVEDIRRDVRVVNLSLIQVDWYINKLRNKVNESAPIKLTLSGNSYLGKNANQVFFSEGGAPMSVLDVMKKADDNIKGGNPYPSFPTRQLFIPFDRTQLKPGAMMNLDSAEVVSQIPVTVGASNGYITKDDLAILDLVASNIYDRPIYFSTTCNPDKLQGLNDYMQLEGLALRVVPVRSQSDPSFGIYGYGKVNQQKHFDIVSNKFKFGNFDKVKTHVDKSYMAAVQSMRLTMMRGAYDFINKGEKAKGVAMIKKYFEGFPHMNFPYDGSASPFISALFLGDDIPEGIKQSRILMRELTEYSNFYASLNSEEASSFMQDISQWQGAAQQLQGILSNDKLNLPADFKAELKKVLDDANAKFSKFNQQPMN
jgi:hypothetical protein